ncbi:MAG TPA: glycosyltransferase [Burkholderiaceae bacterium]|nr:glycosyltransferase [Burkholderiaceae bacterium]
MIPRILHFIWIGDAAPMPRAHVDSWIAAHPGWTVKLWDEAALAASAWRSGARIDAERKVDLRRAVDWMRFEILHVEGGVVADADSFCVSAIPDDLLQADAFACWRDEAAQPGVLATHLLGAIPGHPVLENLLRTVSFDAIADEGETLPGAAERFNRLWRARRHDGLKVLPSQAFLSARRAARGDGVGSDVIALHEEATTRGIVAELHAHRNPLEAPAAGGSAGNPLIDIVVVAYRRYGPLKVLLQCLLNQTTDNWRALVYHDGPDAEFETIARGFEDEAPGRIHHAATPSRHNDYGHSLREMGLKAVQAPYVLITNDDNYYVPKALEFVAEAIAAERPDVVLFDMVHSHQNPGLRKAPSYSYFPTEYSRNNIDIGCAVVRTDLARRAGFRDKGFAGDATYFEDIARAKGGPLRVAKIPRVLFVHN